MSQTQDKGVPEDADCNSAEALAGQGAGGPL